MNHIDKIIERVMGDSANHGCSYNGIRTAQITVEELRALLQEVEDANKKDAERYRWIRSKTQGLRGTFPKDFCFLFPSILPLGNVMKGSVAQYLDEAIDAAIAAEGKE